MIKTLLSPTQTSPSTVVSRFPVAAGEPEPSLGFLSHCLSFPVCVVAMLAVFVYYLVPQSIADPDIWWHLRNAEWQLSTHSFLRQDVFSSTARGAPWIDHEWLAELPFYLAWRFGGAAGVYALTVAAIEIIVAGVFYLAFRRSGSPMASFAVSAIAALLATVSFGPRTLLFGWIFLVVELILLHHFETRENILFFLPPLLGLWINAHGSWLIGAVVFAAFALSGCLRIETGSLQNEAWTRRQARSLSIAAAVSLAALFANPYGWRLVAYPFDLAFRQRLNVANVEEWHALDFHSVRGLLLFAVLGLLFAVQILRRRSWNLRDLSFLVIGVYSAVSYSRFLFLAALLVMPILAPDLSIRGRRAAQARARPWANAGILLFLVPLVVRHLPSATALSNSGEDRFPLQAVGFLQRFHPQGEVWNDFLWGGFLIWNARQLPVFIDSRVDLFERKGVFQDYLDAVRLKNSLAVLDKYHIRYVIFRKDAPLVYLLRHTGEWKTDYEDATAVFLERIQQHPAR